MNKTRLSIIGLLIYGVLATATLQLPWAVTNGVITFVRILNTVRPVISLLNSAKKASSEATMSVNTSFQNLSQYLANRKVNAEVIGSMEGSLTEMKIKADTLRNILNATRIHSETLFELLEARAKQNKTTSLKESMLIDIKAKKETFEEKIKVAKDMLKQIDNSIQKYDDILGYIQVNSALNNVDSYIQDINSVISQSGNLNTNIQAAIDEGLTIVNAIQNQAEINSQSEKK